MHRSFLLLISTFSIFYPPGEGNYSKIVYPGENGQLVYAPDEQGNVILDFSHCGYLGGGVKLPEVDVKVTLAPGDGDDGARLQAAIDEVARLPIRDNGFRGTVLLKKGRYDISDSLHISESGIVLRGEGQDTSGTILYATGTTQRSLINIAGKQNRVEVAGTEGNIIDDYVPVGARSFHVEMKDHAYRVGDQVIVRRIGNAGWIHAIGMDRITPRPSDPSRTRQWEPFDLDYDRVITGIEGNYITVDAPIACAIEKRWGGGKLIKYTDTERIRQVGIENIRGVSSFDKSKLDYEDGERYYSDEDHCETFILIENAVNVWVRNVTALHFIDNCVEIQKGAKWVTVQDCSNLDMVSKIDGGRRGAFQINGQLCLVQRCYAETGRHDFSVSSRVCGPNVFLHGLAIKSYSNSEAHHRWSTGGLFDNVHANLRVEDRQYLGTGHGWAGANYVLWNCEGTLVCQKPPTAQNYAIGHVGPEAEPNFHGKEKGHWESHGQHVTPESLYLKQLEDRLGKRAVEEVTTTEQRNGTIIRLLRETKW
ncbi:MAG: hypothetical protein ACREOO_20540 [bacterium]